MPRRVDGRDETVARMDEQIRPAHPALIQTDGTTAPHSTTAPSFDLDQPRLGILNNRLILMQRNRCDIAGAVGWMTHRAMYFVVSFRARFSQ